MSKPSIKVELMVCCNCDLDLAFCTCADLEERFNQISQHVVIGSDYEKRIREQIERNKTEKTKTE